MLCLQPGTIIPGTLAPHRRQLKGRPEWADDPEYLDRDKRTNHADEVNAMVTAWTQQHTKHEAMEILGAAGIPAGAVLDTGDLLAEKSFQARGIIQTQHHPNGDFRMPTFPVRFDGKPPEIKPAPLLGEHNGEVFSSWLGIERRAMVKGLKDGGGDLRVGPLPITAARPSGTTCAPAVASRAPAPWIAGSKARP